MTATTHWDSEKQAFVASMRTTVSEGHLIALKRDHQLNFRQISFDQYMTKVFEHYLGFEPFEAYDYSDPDLTTFHESLQYQ